MMKKENKQDNEVYILGTESNEKGISKTSKRMWVLLCVGLLIVSAGVYFLISHTEQTPEYYFEPENTEPQTVSIVTDTIKGLDESAYIEVLEETVNDVCLILYIPRNSTMSLFVGMPDKFDRNIIFAAMAADIRKDNMQIVGDFVLSGKRLSRGVAKKGYVAIDNNEITIGVGESTPLLQKVLDNNGSFFRQYPLVHNGVLIENNPKNKSIRRALAIRDEQIFMVESGGKESFHDFSQALIDIGVSDAIYLVGGDAFGWYYDKEHRRYVFGEEKTDLPENISYIIWQ